MAESDAAASGAAMLKRPELRVAASKASLDPGKVIRDSFTMPLPDYALIGALKQRCIGLGIAMKKSELLRAGLTALDQLPDQGLLEVVTAVENVKTGRPPGKKKRKKGKRKKKKKSHGAKRKKQ
jgi:hypothetical protein